jgi:hypothetical protein
VTSDRAWEEASRELLAAGRERWRERFGAPPEDEELLAYAAGELPAEAAARVREYVALHPELVPVLAGPVPDPDPAMPGDPAYLSDEELEQDWQALEARLGKLAPVLPHARAAAARPEPPAVSTPAAASPGAVVQLRRAVQGWRLSTLAAGLLAAVLGGLYFDSAREVRQLAEEARQPRVGPEHRLLLPDGRRGAGGEQPAIPVPLPPDARDLLLMPTLINHPAYPSYRLEVVALPEDGPEKPIWSLPGLVRRRDDSFEILVPRDALDPGRYRLELYGEGRQEPLATYTVQVLSE